MFSISRIQELLKALPRGAFEQAVRQHAGERHAKGFTCWSQLVAMVYAQLSGAASLRQLEAGFNQHVRHHYHLARAAIRRSTLADANAKRKPEVFADTLRLLIEQAGRTVRKQREELLYLLDATSIALSGPSRQAFGSHQSAHGNHGVKLHLLLEANRQTVAQCSITATNVNDIQEGKLMHIAPGATYVFDKGYCDYNWWQSIDEKGARWVTRFQARCGPESTSQRAGCRTPGESDILRDSDGALRAQAPAAAAGHRNAYTGAQLRRIEVARPDAAAARAGHQRPESARPRRSPSCTSARWRYRAVLQVGQAASVRSGRFLGCQRQRRSASTCSPR